MRTAVLACGGGVWLACVLACGGVKTPTTAAADRGDPPPATPPTRKAPAAPARPLDAAAFAEVRAAYQANPTAAARTYQGVRWRFAGRVSNIDGDSAVLDPAGIGGEWFVGFAAGEVEKVANGQTCTVEAELFTGYDAAERFPLTFRKARVVAP